MKEVVFEDASLRTVIAAAKPAGSLQNPVALMQHRDCERFVHVCSNMFEGVLDLDSVNFIHYEGTALHRRHESGRMGLSLQGTAVDSQKRPAARVPLK